MIVIRMMTKSDCDQKNGNMFNWGGAVQIGKKKVGTLERDWSSCGVVMQGVTRECTYIHSHLPMCRHESLG